MVRVVELSLLPIDQPPTRLPGTALGQLESKAFERCDQGSSEVRRYSRAGTVPAARLGSHQS